MREDHDLQPSRDWKDRLPIKGTARATFVGIVGAERDRSAAPGHRQSAEFPCFVEAGCLTVEAVRVWKFQSASGCPSEGHNAAQ
jgi:hypothetical protein